MDEDKKVLCFHWTMNGHVHSLCFSVIYDYLLSYSYQTISDGLEITPP